MISACSKDETTTTPIPPPPPAKISYYDWSPDIEVYDSVFIDLNHDSIADIRFQCSKVYQGSSPSGGAYYNYFVNCLSANANVGVSLGVETDPSQRLWDCLLTDDIISDSLTWNDSFTLEGSVIVAGGIGIWDINPVHEGYVAFRIKSAESSNFGWLRIHTEFNAFAERYEITCFEYAISETANKTIKAGQKE